MLGGQSVVAPPMGNKAFSDYRATGGVSPYMNLFRRDNGGTVDNYSTMVKPQLDQQRLNQQFNRDINGLGRTMGLQSPGLYNNDNRAPQGVGTPQFYMNGGYP
jgi:hypothetical protein